MKHDNENTRRAFIKSVALGGGATMIIGPQAALAEGPQPQAAPEEPRSLSDFEEVLKRCGSEFGNINEAG